MSPPTLCVAADYGSTGPRAIWTLLSRLDPNLCFLWPHVCELPRAALDAYRQNALGQARPEDDAWVSIGDRHWAIGRLAVNAYAARLQLEPLKIDLAVTQTLALVGAIARRCELPATFDLNLGCLLPVGEYHDRERLEAQLAQALGNFSFRDRAYACSLVKFSSRPEGFGLFGSASPQTWQDATDGAVGIVAIGFRNSSQLVMDRGHLQGHTDDFGFSFALRLVAQSTSGQQYDNPTLIAAASQPTPEKRRQALAAVARSRSEDNREAEVDTLARAVEAARERYFHHLKERFQIRFPRETRAIVLGGGTAVCCRRDLQRTLRELFPSRRVRLEFGQEAIARCRQTLGPQMEQREIAPSRLADAYGFYTYLLKRQFVAERVVAR